MRTTRAPAVPTVGGMAVGLIQIVLGRVVVDTVSSMAGMVLVVTGLLAGALRALAVLSNSPAERVESLTAMGFIGGAGVAFLFFLLDAAIG